jgi:hypothetical protein
MPNGFFTGWTRGDWGYAAVMVPVILAVGVFCVVMLTVGAK